MRDFAALVDRIIEMEPGVAHCRDTVEKEVLHHELLGAMRDAGLLRHLTLKGRHLPAAVPPSAAPERRTWTFPAARSTRR